MKRSTRSKRSRRSRTQRGGDPYPTGTGLSTYVSPGNSSLMTNSVGAFNQTAANIHANNGTGNFQSVHPWENKEPLNWNQLPPSDASTEQQGPGFDPTTGLALGTMGMAAAAKYKYRERSGANQGTNSASTSTGNQQVSRSGHEQVSRSGQEQVSRSGHETDRRLGYFNLPTLVNVDRNRQPSIFGLGSTGITRSRRQTKSRKKKTTKKQKKTKKQKRSRKRVSF